MTPHKIEDYKITAVQYYLSKNQLQTCEIFQYHPRSLMRTSIKEIKKIVSKNTIIIPENTECNEILFMLVLQHLCYNIALLKKINPDKPKNLAKVVTVE